MFKQLQRSALLLAAMLASLQIIAYNFGKDGVYYNISSSEKQTVYVTYYDWYSNSNAYSGDVVIPATVAYNGIIYTVEYIGNNALRNCSNLTSITITEGVTNIGNYAFYQCSKLTSVSIPQSVTHIGNYAFYGCSNLTSVSIPKSGVKGIGDWAFYDCSNLKNFTIPESVTSIGNSAFRQCDNLTGVSIPEGVTSIGDVAFYGCSSLTSINIPEGVTSIGNSMFSFCDNLTDVSIPRSVTSIGEGAFYQCLNLTNVTIPEGVTSIGENAFYNCSSLASIAIPEGLTSIGDYVFNGCSSLADVTIPKSVTNIGEGAFGGTNLASITIPECVTNIGNYAFQSCSNLMSIIIPQSITFIGYRAFYDCTNLDIIYCQAATPPTLGSYNFRGVFSDYNATVYVPAGTKTSYQSATEWSNFSNIVEVVYAEISPIGYSSFASKYAVDFSGQEGLTAYIGKYNEAENTLTLTEVTDAPAETGLILKGEAGKTYALAVTETATTTDKGDLKAVTEDAQVNSEMNNYVLSKVGEEVGFYRFTGTDIAAGHSYLELPAATNARAITLSFDNTTTGISSLNAAATTEAQPKDCYNLSGQRVAKPTKGLYIIGGKKVVVK